MTATAVAVEPAGRAADARSRADTSGSKHPARATAPAAAPTAPPAPPPAAPDCTHPFFVDGDGIKKYRPECM